MGSAVQNFRMVLEAQSRGEQSMKAFEDAFNRVVSAQEKAAAKQQDLAGKSTRAAKDVGSAFSGFGGTIKSGFADPLGTAGAELESFLGRLGPAGTLIGSLGAALAAAGTAAFALAAKTGNLAEQQSNNAIRLGVSIRDYGLLAQASENAGLSQDALVGTMKGLAKALSDNSEEGRKGKAALQEIGVTATDVFGQVKPMRELLLEIADGLGGIENPGKRADAAMKILGRSGMEVLPLMNRELRNTVSELERMGVGFTDAGAKTALAFDAALDKLTTRLKATTKALGVSLSEMLLAILDAEASAKAAEERQQQRRNERGRTEDLFGAGSVRTTPFGTNQNVLGGAPTSTFFREMMYGGALPRGADGRSTFGGIPGFTVSAEQLQQQLRVSGQAQIRALQLAAPESRLQDAQQKMQDAFEAGDKALYLRYQRQAEQIKAEIEATSKGEAERKRFRESIQKLGEAQTDFLRFSLPAVRREGSAALLERQFASFVAPEGDRIDIQAGQRQRDSAFGAALVARQIEAQRRAAELDRQSVAFQIRKIELLTGSGGELAAVERIAAIKTAALEREIASGAEIANIEQRRAEIAQERETRLLELQRNRLNELRTIGGSIFDSLTAAGQGGIRQFGEGLLRGQGRTLFSNVFAEFTRSSTGAFQLPGQRGANGELNTFGRILQGTVFASKADPLKLATDANTVATNANTQALLAAAGVKGGAAAGGFLGSLGPLFSGAQSNPMIFNAASRTAGSGGFMLDDVSGYNILTGAPNFTRSMPGWAKTAGYAGAAVGGALALSSGIQQGGIRGALTAGGGLAGAGASILQLAGVSGPLAPILATVGLGLSLAPLLLGDPKQARARALESEAGRRQFLDPTGATYFQDAMGRGYDYNIRGEMRPIVVNINAMDAKSIVDRAPDIGEAVRRAVTEYPPLLPELRNALIPA